MATDLTPGLVFALGWATIVVAIPVMVALYFAWRTVRQVHEVNQRMVTAFLALAPSEAAKVVAANRSVAELTRAKQEAQEAHPKPRPARPVGA